LDRSRSDSGPYVFVSYASVDRAKALQIADLLETNGISVWIDRKSIAGGTSWSAEIVREFKRCAARMVLCSPTSLDSRNVQETMPI
jgi:TIR domain